MQNLLSRRSGPAAIVLTAFAAIVIGCGGGGGGGGNGNGSASSGNADAGGNAGGSGVTDGSSAGDPGGVGSLPQDSIFYVSSPSGSAFDVKYIKADGSGQGTYASGVANDASPMVADPNAVGEFVFAAIPSGGSTYGIYRNTTASTTGATTIVNPTFSSVSSLQISRDGTKVVFIATTGDVNSAPFRLYKYEAGATPALTNIDDAFAASLSSAGDRVVYNKFPSDADNDPELYIRKFAETTSHQLTNNSLGEEDPQFSHDGASVVFSQQVSTSSTRYRLASIDLATGVVTTLDPSPSLQTERAPSLNLAGNKITYIGTSNGDASESGLFVADFPSGANVAHVVTSSDLRFGTYWSTPTGRSLRGDTLRLSIARKR